MRTGYAKFDVQNPPLNFTLNQAVFHDAGALSHMGIQVASTADVLAVRQRWADAGLITRDEMQTDCCYARQDKTCNGLLRAGFLSTGGDALACLKKVSSFHRQLSSQPDGPG